MGIVRTATEAKLAELTAPDVALSALALRLAELLDSEEANAAAALQYRLTLNALVNQSKPMRSLDDLADDLDDDIEYDPDRWAPERWPQGQSSTVGAG